MKKYPLNQVKYYNRFRDMLDDLVLGNDEKKAVSWFNRKGEEQGVTWGKFYSDIVSLQERLVDLGLAGKHIAILSENSYEWLLVYLSAVYCGAVAVCIDVEQSTETIKQMLDMADVDCLFYVERYKDISLSYCGQSRPMYAMYANNEPSIYDLISEGGDLRASGKINKDIDATVTPEATASIVFTSGTMTYSKPVMLSQEAILTNASDALANVSIGEVAFTALPFYHTYGLTCSVLSMLIGKAHLYINGNIKTVMRDIQLANPHTMLTVPLMLETIHSNMWVAVNASGKADKLKKLLNIRKFLLSVGIKKNFKVLDSLREKCFGSIRLIICGGAHMSRNIMEEFFSLGVLVVQGYGITECSPLVSVNRNKMNKFDSVGLVSAHTEVKIEDGEILVRGKNIMKGYYNLPELTDEVLTDGWFRTGDIGELDKDGFLHITGRKKNLIVFRNGKKVSPEKLEAKIQKIPLVQDVVVYGAVSGISTDDVQVAASVFPNKEATEGMNSYEILEALQEQISLINEELPMYQQIRMINIREQEFSKTALKKIKRYLV
ncbi:MAG: hypothetical protein E7477_01060 [Ruminococcaceae bacterium]|nr:hypothetical protein [Oscillospiraceae bacterium]